jgi:hypothetical protein
MVAEEEEMLAGRQAGSSSPGERERAREETSHFLSSRRRKLAALYPRFIRQDFALSSDYYSCFCLFFCSRGDLVCKCPLVLDQSSNCFSGGGGGDGGGGRGSDTDGAQR